MISVQYETGTTPYTTLFRSSVQAGSVRAGGGARRGGLLRRGRRPHLGPPLHLLCLADLLVEPDAAVRVRRDAVHTSVFRSEEHTSELQSRENLVCRLLLEKK